jgi:hypothetical protein
MLKGGTTISIWTLAIMIEKSVMNVEMFYSQTYQYLLFCAQKIYLVSFVIPYLRPILRANYCVIRFTTFWHFHVIVTVIFLLCILDL